MLRSHVPLSVLGSSRPAPRSQAVLRWSSCFPGFPEQDTFKAEEVQLIALWFCSFILLWCYLFSSPGRGGSRAIQLKYVFLLIHLFMTL